MNLKEYKVQLALGTVDFRLVAEETHSSTVLQDIIGRTDDIAVLCAVATNPRANIYTLTLLATFPEADEGVVISCAYHPNTILSVLERWMKYPTIECICAVQQRMRALQLASGISEEDALVIEKPLSERFNEAGKLLDPFKGGCPPSAPDTQKEYVIWTSTGNNVSIEMDDSRFKFASDPDDNALYYCYDRNEMNENES
ncbi:hypothetical protein KAU11_07110 [Candidatus Babeliales bacterium]|nr:hypothetical protein [Candidatus Babeliales bacterium]